jgi:hypothetical protein
MLIYIAGPYRGDVTTNIANARRVAVELWEKGYNVICPHLNTSSMELDCKMPDARYLGYTLTLRCDGGITQQRVQRGHAGRDCLLPK